MNRSRSAAPARGRSAKPKRGAWRPALSFYDRDLDDAASVRQEMQPWHDSAGHEDGQRGDAWLDRLVERSIRR